MATLEERKEFSGPTERLSFVHVCLVFVFAVLGIIHLIFAPPTTANFIYAGVLILASLMIVGGINLLKLLVDRLHKACGTRELAEHRNVLLIGYGVAAILSGVVKIVSFFVTVDERTFLFFTFLYMLTVTYISTIFNCHAFDRVNWNTGKTHNMLSVIVISSFLVHVFLLITSIKIAMEYQDPDVNGILILCQFACGALFGTSITEFLVVLGVGVKFRKGYTPRPARQEDAEMVPLKKGKNEKSKHNATGILVSRPICNICLIQFSDQGSGIPRMLKECGHTVCEKCANNLLKTNSILCPYCQQTTDVNGPVGTLPKNFALIEMMEEVQQKFEGQIYHL